MTQRFYQLETKYDILIRFMKVAKLPAEIYATDMHWFPKLISGKKQSQPEILALGSTDGKKRH